MTRDTGLEAQLSEDFGHSDNLSGKPMFGGWCFLMNGNMLAAAREGRAMFRVGKAAETAALALPGTEPMSQGGRAKPGFVWLSGPALSDDAIRGKLAGMAREYLSTLPPKDA